jgi:hypothetical protein
VRRRKLPAPAAVSVYELTAWGRQLEPPVLALGRWATASPSFPRGAEMGPDSLVLALKSSLVPAKAGALDATYELLLAEIPFRLRVADGEFDAARREAEAPDAVIRSDPNVIAGIVFGGNQLGKAVESGDLEIDGSRRAVNALFRTLS